MAHTIRIKRRGRPELYFDVDDGAGQRVATSAAFDTICRLESGLAVLVQAAKCPERTVVERGADFTSIGSSPGRKRVRFVGCLDESGVRDLLSGAAMAKVVDERPAAHRRADLSGRLCELGH